MEVSKCKFCKKEIEQGAKKCDKCGANQTFSGRFIHAWIPILSFMFVCFSWVQTYIEYQDKKIAQRQADQAQEAAKTAEIEKVSALTEKQEAQQTVLRYSNTINEIEKEVQQLKRTNTRSPAYLQHLKVIDQNIQKSKLPTKEINGIKYAPIDN